MRVPSSENRAPVGANMTPMIDVVFLLIIFFLVSSHLARQENHLPVELPTASSFLPINPDRTALTVSIDADSRWLISGNVVELAELKGIFRDYLERSGPLASIRLRTDGSVPYSVVEPVLREAALSGIYDVSLSVREKGGS